LVLGEEDENIKHSIDMNEIFCGDARLKLRKLESNSIDLVVTSPPYFHQRQYTDSYREIGAEITDTIYLFKLLDVFFECHRVVKPTGSIVWNMGDVYQQKSLQLLPHRFAIMVLDSFILDDFPVKLINEITWVKSNPTPRQYNKRLVPATEPFFHFVKSDKYYYNRDEFLKIAKSVEKEISYVKGQRYLKLIDNSDLTEDEKRNAIIALGETVMDYRNRKITDFRMKIRGVHKKAFGGQQGGRNNQIDKQGYTIIRFSGKKMKRDVIESSVANSKNIAHPAIFPLKVISNVIQLLSVEGNVVLDPFCGSGQVCVAAKSLGRQYLGIDLNPNYCKMTKKRLANLPKK